MKKILTLLTCFLSFTYAASIENIQVAQRTDGSGILDITYDLIDDTFPSFTVEVEFSFENNEFEPYPFGAANMSGDVGEDVIPGIGKSIQINAPENTYSSDVVIKIKASAYMVTTELPFSMISITSTEGVSTYQGETLDYNFEIMQNELTNAELVTFLETYEFTLTDGSPVYNCSEYTEYYNADDDDDNYVSGCTDDEALNYNSLATSDDGSCAYEQELGCTNYNSPNYDENATVNDCSCWYDNYLESTWVGEDQVGDICNWASHPNCNNMQNGSFDCDLNNDGQGDIDLWENYIYYPTLCNDETALNYPSGIETFINNLPNPECFDVAPGQCAFECDYGISGGDHNDDDEDWGEANIEDFETENISFEGSSFVIESGAGTKPAIFNYENCVDGVIVGLLLNHYGLRYPTGAEWTKAARQDNERCWPWLNGSCEDEALSYCSNTYTCMTEQEYEQCEESLDDMQLNCQIACNENNSTCMQDCQGDSMDVNCSDYFTYDECENTDYCNWSSETSYCYDPCYNCMEALQCPGGPCSEGCECCDLCDHTGDDFDWDCNTECNNTMMTCMNDCGNNYGDSYEYCGQEEMQNCNWNLESCTQDNYACQNFSPNDYESLLDGSYDYDTHGFISYIYTNKFHFAYNENYWDNPTSINVIDISQYPDGISPFGLYDMIGNAPEVVKHNNKLWLVGLSPASSSLRGFCSDNGIFGEDYNDHATGLSFYAGETFNMYGLRLARIITQ